MIELFFVMAAKGKVKNLAEFTRMSLTNFKDNHNPLGIHKRQGIRFMCNMKLPLKFRRNLFQGMRPFQGINPAAGVASFPRSAKPLAVTASYI